MSPRSTTLRSTPLRQQMIRELELQRKSPQTIKAYVMAVRQLAEHYGRSLKAISHDEVREFLRHLIVDRKSSVSSVNQKLAGIRFLYRRVLGQADFDLRIDRKRSGRLPEPLGREEVRRLLDAVANRKHCAMLMTAYVRVAELVRLRVEDIHSQRMLIHVRCGKGNKDRYTLLSARLRLRAVRVPQLPQPPLPQVPDAGQRGVARSQTGRTVAGAVLSSGVDAAARAQRLGARQPA